MKGTFPIHKFRKLETPFYYYDTNLLRHTLDTIRKEAGKYNKFCVHYAVKANANSETSNICKDRNCPSLLYGNPLPPSDKSDSWNASPLSVW